MSELRIALVMGGGVSLGSFSGGALSQMLALLQHVERGPAKIDVVTGASAGSMTLAIMLYHLFRGSDPATIEAALEAAWVDRIDVDALRPDLSRHQAPSLFSDAIVRKIAEDVLDFRDWQSSGPHPYFSEGTLVSFALTNMNGIPVRAEGQLIRQPTASGGAATGADSVFADAVQTTFHDDTMRFSLFREEPQAGAPRTGRVLRPWTGASARQGWRVFREAAIASGAFPAAFPPVRLPRLREEYSIWPEELPGAGFGFDFVDGGVLRNEPLREAIHLAALRDEGDDVERVFILIDPNVSGTRELYPLGYNQALRMTSTRDDAGEIVSIAAGTGTYVGRLMGVLGRLVGVLASQAAFRDWIRAAKVNSQIEWRDELTEILAQVSVPSGSDAEARLDGLLQKIYTDKAVRRVGPSGQIDVERVRTQLNADLQKRANGAGVSATTKLLLLVDLIANLRDKRKINLVAITPSSTPDGRPLPIAGDFLSNFGGFFSRDYRAFDFKAGEYAANSVLTANIEGARSLLRDGAPILPRPAHPPIEPSYSALPWSVRQRFEALIGDHVRQVAATAGIPGLVRGWIASKVQGKVRKALIAGHAASAAAFVIEITNSGGLYLRARDGSADTRAGGDGRVQTVVAAQARPSNGESGWELVGPHVHSGPDGDSGRLELWERRFLRPSRRRATIVLDGQPGEWFRRARHSAVPLLRVAVNGDAEIVARPDALEDLPTPLERV